MSSFSNTSCGACDFFTPTSDNKFETGKAGLCSAPMPESAFNKKKEKMLAKMGTECECFKAKRGGARKGETRTLFGV